MSILVSVCSATYPKFKRRQPLTLANIEMLVAKDPINGCWLWQETRNRNGYATGSGSAAQPLVHRLVYTLAHGQIPTGMLVRHVCHVRHCVNPAHLILGTHQDNANDRQQRYNKPVRTHCKRGHEFVSGSYIKTKRYHKVCLICRKELDEILARKLTQST